MQTRGFRLFVISLFAFGLVTASVGPVAADSALVKSLFIPGIGQANKGHYNRAAVFAASAVLSGAGLFLSQIQYNRSVDDYNNHKRVYVGYPEALEGGAIISYSEIQFTYDEMTRAYNTADDRIVWRDTFLVALIATYAFNIIDVIRLKEDTGEVTDPVSVQMTGANSFRVVKTFNF
jgi:hypothetical protein